MNNNNNSFEYVKNAILHVQNHGGENNILRIEMPKDYYMQMICEKGSKEILIEAVSNNFLNEFNKLDATSVNYLVNLGWEAPKDKNENFKIETTISNNNELKMIVDLIIESACNAYGVENITQKRIEIELDN
jgi:hypothetical protein